ncbi:MAG TPA: acylneuraminate cytidylyltransferase [Gemmatimonas sp.]|nr:acylneuraminate cytidylyltransferase [Gemmatimonas sp.]
MVTGTLALIPARGGSKSIPRKNIRAFRGHALIAWSIAAARESASVDRIVVTTDDEEIRDVAIACGADAPFLRPAELAQDDTTDLPVVQHAIHWLQQHEGFDPALIVQLRPTSPIRPRGLVDAAVARLCAEPSGHSLRAVTEAGQNPYKMWRMREEFLEPLMAHHSIEPYNLPRQALPSTYWQTGHIDVMRRATVDEGSLSGLSIVPLRVEPRFAADLDTEDQWEHAEWLAGRHRDDIVYPRRSLDDLQRYRLLALDFDGVLTDNRVIVHEDGGESVVCDRGDGLGLAALRARGFPVVVLSSETHPVVSARCRKLGIPCRQGLGDKGAALREYAAQLGVPLEDVIYVGNDVNDLECLRMAGLAVIPADAHPAVHAEADWTLSHAGGRGAVRELCDLLLGATVT